MLGGCILMSHDCNTAVWEFGNGPFDHPLLHIQDFHLREEPGTALQGRSHYFYRQMLKLIWLVVSLCVAIDLSAEDSSFHRGMAMLAKVSTWPWGSNYVIRHTSSSGCMFLILKSLLQYVPLFFATCGVF